MPRRPRRSRSRISRAFGCFSSGVAVCTDAVGVGVGAGNKNGAGFGLLNKPAIMEPPSLKNGASRGGREAPDRWVAMMKRIIFLVQTAVKRKKTRRRGATLPAQVPIKLPRREDMSRLDAEDALHRFDACEWTKRKIYPTCLFSSQG